MYISEKTKNTIYVFFYNLNAISVIFNAWQWNIFVSLFPTYPSPKNK